MEQAFTRIASALEKLQDLDMKAAEKSNTNHANSITKM